MTLWTAAEAVAATGGTTSGDWGATGVSIDTRTLQSGDLFVALKDARDGHDFVAQALQKGAAAALVSHRPDGVDEDAPLLIVADVLNGLENLGRAARARTSARVVGITGSVGKTSTKEMLRDVLSSQGKTHAAEASYNNHWGVPLTLARMPADADYAVIEIGMSNPGEIAPLARLTRPDAVVITTVAAAHLEAFDSIEAIAHEKAAIMEGMSAGGPAIINADIGTADILYCKALETDAAPIGFGETATDWAIESVRLAGDKTVIEAQYGADRYLFKLSVAGRHFAANAVAVLAAVDALGADPMQASLDIAKWQPPAGRGTREVISLDMANTDETIDLIDDAFNANPTSMAAAFEVLAASTPRDNIGRVIKGRKVAILGDMLELGPDEASLHAALASDPGLQDADLVHCAGPRMRHLMDALPEERRGIWSETAAELAAKPTVLVDAGDVVLVKGSKGSKISLVVDAIRKLGQA